jgi:hypothetical protein
MSTVSEPAKTQEVFDFLRMCANEMRTTTYGELATAVGLARNGTGPQLDAVAERCRAMRLPSLWALVVNQATRRPGPGYWPEWLPEEHRESYWRSDVLRVLAFEWSSVP